MIARFARIGFELLDNAVRKIPLKLGIEQEDVVCLMDSKPTSNKGLKIQAFFMN